MSIATEFNKFKDVLFGKKIIRHKMKRIQSKKHKLGTYENSKISLLCFDGKRYVLEMEFVCWLIFIKIVLQVVKRLKKIVIKKKRLKRIIIKKIVIIKKGCDKKGCNN